MKKLAIALACLFAAQSGVSSAQEQQTLELRKNTRIVDANGRPLGKIRSIDEAQGYVIIIENMKPYPVPISSLALEDGRLVTSLTREQVGL